jgi:hypothetical protein
MAISTHRFPFTSGSVLRFFGNPVRPISVSILRWEYNVELGDEFLQLLDFSGVQGRPIATHLSITHRAIQPSKNSVLHRRSALSV